jgi:hypothetical protein
MKPCVCMNVRACVRERAGAEIHVTSIKIKNIYIVHDFFIRKNIAMSIFTVIVNKECLRIVEAK